MIGGNARERNSKTRIRDRAGPGLAVSGKELGATLIGEASELLDKSRAALARAGENIVGDGSEGSPASSDGSSGDIGSDAGNPTGEAPDKG